MDKQNLASEKNDLKLAAAALEKRRAGQKASVREAAALRRIERDREETLRWQYYATIPKGHYRILSGRQVTVLNAQAAEYNLPIGGATIDLAKLLTRLHDFLADNKYKLRALSDDDAENLIGASQSLKDAYLREKIKVTREQAIRARLERRALERIPDPPGFSPRGARPDRWNSASLGGRLERRFGKNARKMLDDALDNSQRQIDALVERHRTLTRRQRGTSAELAPRARPRSSSGLTAPWPPRGHRRGQRCRTECRLKRRSTPTIAPGIAGLHLSPRAASSGNVGSQWGLDWQ